MAEIGQMLTLGNLVVAGDARDTLGFIRSQMGQMGEFQVHCRP